MLMSEQLHAIMPQLPSARGAALFPFLTAAAAEFSIDAPARAAAFLAQLAHESGQFRFMEEIWGPTAAQRRYEPPGTLAATLGNTQAGDGKRFKGRGPIQITGRANYRRFGDLLGLDLVADPGRAALPDVAFRIAGLYWSKKRLNELADQVSPEAFREITRRINGGFNGLPDRERFYELAKSVLGVTPPPVTRGGARAPAEVDDPDFGRGYEAIRSDAARRRGRKIGARKGTSKKRAPKEGGGRKRGAKKKTSGTSRAKRSARKQTATGPSRPRTTAASRRPRTKGRAARSKK
jgi:predicted chitinase